MGQGMVRGRSWPSEEARRRCGEVREPDAGKRCRLRQPGRRRSPRRQRAEGRAHVALVPGTVVVALMLTGAFAWDVRRRMMVMPPHASRRGHRARR